MSAERPTYLDSSAIVKLVRSETESVALRSFLGRRRPQVSSALARTEVLRAAGLHGAVVVRRARQVLGRLELLRVSDGLLTEAGVLLPGPLRSLDAIHLVTAQRLGPELRAVVTYDDRMAEAARAIGLPVAAPA